MTEQSEQSPAPEQADTAAPDAGPNFAAEAEKWQALAKKHEARAKENAKAADELAALKQSQMTEAERTMARLAEMERETQAARAEALRFRIATRYGINDDDAELYLTGTDEELLERQAKGLAERAAAAVAAQSSTPAPAGPRPDLSQGAKDMALNGDPIEQRLKSALGIT